MSDLETYKILVAARSDAVEVDMTKFKKDLTGKKTEWVGEKPYGEDNEHMHAWMIKLGSFIKYNLGNPNDKANYAFRIPKGYTLREKKYPSKEVPDYMLYGHPMAPNSPFRNVAEFAPHLLWLVSSSMDYQDCSCDKCKSWCAKVAANNAAIQPQASAGRSDLENVSGLGMEMEAGSGSRGARLTTTSSVVQSSSAPTPSSTGASSGWVEVQRSLGGGSEVFRAGELVWYQVLAWRLGIIREITYSSRVGGEVRFVRVAPISHVSLKAQDVVNPKVMRPFLSFSVPAGTPEFEGKFYEQVDWVQQARHYLSTPGLSQELLGLEASKMAARMINWSFSLFNGGPAPSATGGQQTWGGSFLGAELIFNGDALRVTSAETEQANPNDFDVMLLASITKQGTHLNFSGDVYRLTRTKTGNPQPASPVGAVFAHEIRIRNEVTASKGIAWAWVLVERGGVRDEQSTWGRFYVTDGLIGAINPGVFEQAAQNGEVVDASRFLNFRLQPPVNYIGRKPNRMAMLGNSVSSAIVPREDIREDGDDAM